MLTIISLIPLCTELGYIWGAWRQSPLDSKNWLFVVVALLLGVIFRRRIAGWAQTQIDWRALVPVVICIAGLVFGELRHIHALVILSAVGLTSSTVLLM
ncbi:MAG: hypothetical protein PHI35_03150 [Victivallaceae bacterium]|nr:hypothetical protein [Victivallaceae bacterium]